MRVHGTEPSAVVEPSSEVLDNLGIVASVICVIHCLSMPLLVTALPMLGVQFLESDLTHEILAFAVVAFAILAIVPGYLKHRNLSVLAGMTVGLALVLFATFGSESMLGDAWELPLISIGNLIVVFTHMRNRTFCACKHG